MCVCEVVCLFSEITVGAPVGWENMVFGLIFVMSVVGFGFCGVVGSSGGLLFLFYLVIVG